MGCNCNCNETCEGSSITLPSAQDVTIQYSQTGLAGSWVEDPTTVDVFYIRFSLDGGENWENEIELPVAGETTLSRILYFISNGVTGYQSTGGSTSLQYLGTEYHMDNSSSVLMSVNGDTLIAEAYFIVEESSNERTVGLKIGTSSPAALADLAAYTFTPLTQTVVKLRGEFTRVQSNGGQYYEGKYEVFGLPNVEVGQTLETLNVDFTAPNDLYIQPYCIESDAASDNTVLKFFKVTIDKKLA